MTTLPINEKVPDNGHDSASEEAAKAEADRLAAEATEAAKRTRSPIYHVFEGCGNAFSEGMVRVMLDAAGLNAEAAEAVIQDAEHMEAWHCLAINVPGATDRKAITAVIGTHEEPVEGFDAERRLLPHVAVLTRHWEVRRRTRTVNEPTAKERAELEKRLAGTVTEDWS